MGFLYMPIEPDRKKQYDLHKAANVKDYPSLLMDWFHMKTGYRFDLQNPITFNEKIQWLKLFGNIERYTDLTDKLKVRSYVGSRIGEQYLVPLLGVWDNFQDINFKVLPKKFMLKCNHGCEMNTVINNQSLYGIRLIKKEFEEWLNINFAFFNGFELQYKNICPKLFAEQYIENNKDNLDDYKVWCFNGIPKYIMYMTNRNNELQELLFDTEWNKQFFIPNNKKQKPTIDKPDNLSEILNISATLSEGIPFVRIDLYRLNDGTIKFGEMTFTPASGTFRWNPVQWDQTLGNLLTLPKYEKVR